MNRLLGNTSFFTGNTGLTKIIQKSFLEDVEVAPPVGGRIMSSLAGYGGLAGLGGIAGKGGGLAG